MLMVKPTDSLRPQPVAELIASLREAQERDRKIIREAQARMAERDRIIQKLMGEG